MRRQNSQLAQLIAPSQGLGAPKPKSSLVATPQNLPSMIQYGHLPPGQAQSSRFTGGVASNASTPTPTNVAPADYSAPTYSQPQAPAGGYTGGVTLNPLHLLLALALAGSSGGSGGADTGAGGPRPQVPIFRPQAPVYGGTSSGAPRPQAPLTGGAADNRPQAAPSGRPQVPISAGAIATLAQQGQKPGSRLTRPY